MLGVLTILAILITIVLSIIPLTQHTAEKQRAGTEANALVQAVMHYRQVYGKWPCEEVNSNGYPFVAGMATNDNLFTTNAFVAADSSAPDCTPDIDASQILRALQPDSAENPRGLLFLPLSSDALLEGRLVDPWNHPYRIVMGAERIVFHFDGLIFSNLPAFAVSLGPPAVNPTASSSNWIFSAGVRP
jgi:type II secretory pathway pseudopilin PulG